MKEEEYKKHIEFAKNLTKDQPEPFKTESFKIILNKLLESDISIRKSPSSKKRTPQKSQDKEVVEELTIVENPEEIMSGLANELGVELDQLQDTISIKDKKFEILTSIQGSSKTEKTIKAILCILLIYDKFFNMPWVKSEDITEYLRDLGIPDTGKNMSTYMKQHSNLFRLRSSARYKEYKLTTSEGKIKSLEILKELTLGVK